MTARRISQTAKKTLYIEEELFPDEDIVFQSIKQILEFYYNGLVGLPKSVALESFPEKSVDSSTFHSPLLDAFATIGYYLEKLGRAERIILAFFYGRRLSDKEIANTLNQENGRRYDANGVKYLRIKQIKWLDKKFRAIKILCPRI